jgi:hypothetical protein
LLSVAAACVALLSVAAAAFAGWMGMVAALGGGALALVNLYALARIAEGALFEGQPRKRVFTGLAVKGMLWLGVAVAVAWGLRADGRLLMAFALGLSSPVIAALTSPLFLQGAPAGAREP